MKSSTVSSSYCSYILILLLSGHLGTEIRAYSSTNTSRFGETCDGRTTRWCDFESGTWCRGSTCKCFGKSAAMAFDADRGKCVSKVWFPCGDLSTQDVPKPAVECVLHATCIRGECRCNEGFEESLGNGHCLPIIVMKRKKRKV